MSGQVITHLGACELPDGPLGEVRGYWREATCDEYNRTISAAGGLGALHVWSTLTDLGGRFGTPYLFTCWGTEDVPVAAHGGHPDRRHPCEHRHAVAMGGHAKTYHKCELHTLGLSFSQASDIRVSWPACVLFEKEVP